MNFSFFIVFFFSIKNIPLNCLALSSFGFPIHLCFAFFFAASDINFHISGHTSSGREVFCFLVSLHPDRVNPSGGLSCNRTNLVNPVHAPDNSFSPIFNLFFQQHILCRMSGSGNVDVLHRNRKCFFPRHVQFDSWYNEDDDKWILLWSSRSHFELPHHPASSRLEVGLENLIHLTFLEEFPVLLLVPDAPWLRWMFSERCSHQKIFTVPSATRNMKFPLLCGVNTSFALTLRAWSSDASISSNSSMSATIMSPFQIHPRTVHNREIYLARLLLQTDAV